MATVQLYVDIHRSPNTSAGQCLPESVAAQIFAYYNNIDYRAYVSVTLAL